MFQRNRFIPKCIVDCGDDLWIWLWAGMAFGHGYGILIITTRAMSLPFIWLSTITPALSMRFPEYTYEMFRLRRAWWSPTNIYAQAARRSGAASRYNQAAGICDDNCDLHDSAAALPSI